MQTAAFLHGNDNSKDSWKPLSLQMLNVTGSTLIPTNYYVHADHAYQTAARYGRTKVNANLIKVSNTNAPLSGTNLLKYIELWNEPDPWWNTDLQYFEPYEFAAMLSADYDGHEGAMPNTVGILNADPTMKVVMGGLAGLKLDYVRTIYYWALYNRNDKTFPAHVVNMHHYCNNAPAPMQPSTSGISPEQDNLKEQLLALRSWLNIYLPGVEFWLSEFGWDTNQASPQRAPAIGPYTGEEVQAQWIVRAYLAIAAAGLDRAHQFWLEDITESGGTYGSSGMIWADGVPKVVWYYVYTMKNRMGNMAFQKDLSDGANNVSIYKFFTPGGNEVSYVLWSPTSQARVVNNYMMKVEESVSTVLQVTLQNATINGVETTLKVSGNAVVIPTVSEIPLFIITSTNDKNDKKNK